MFFLFALLVLYRHCGAVLHVLLRGEGECALAPVPWGCREKGLAVGKDGYLFRAGYAVKGKQLISHHALKACDKMSSLGVELEVALGRVAVYPVVVCLETAWTVEHVAELPVGIVQFVIDREHTAEDGIITPVEHISGVGAYLVVARQIRRVKVYLAVAGTVIGYLVFLGLHNISLGRDKLHIEHTAVVGGTVIAVAGDIGLEPHCLAKII